MDFLDMSRLGMANLWQSKLRSALTILGVIVGIGALTSMVSFGTGMQKNITDNVKKSDLFTSLTITPGDMDNLRNANVSNMKKMLKKSSVTLNDSTILYLKSIPHVELVFPEITFEAKAGIKETTETGIQAIPAAMSAYFPFNELLAGDFFSSDSDSAVVVSWEKLRDMGFAVQTDEQTVVLSAKDSAKNVKIVPPDSIIGKEIKIKTAVLNSAAVNPLSPKVEVKPFTEKITELKIKGILKKRKTFSRFRFSAGIFIPLQLEKQIPRLHSSNIWDILNRKNKQKSYASIYVRVDDMKYLTQVREKIEAKGLHVFSVLNQLDDIKRSFLIIDAILGAIGTIALFVAALGIINTMVMSILERRREIGIMKAIGASDREIKTIFFIEAGTIGFIGALFGLLIGWLVTRLANLVLNTQLRPAGEEPVDLFYFPLWLIFGAVLFSIIVSLAAGLYPAIKAARLDPVKALRHD